MFAYKTSDAAALMNVPASRLRYWRSHLPGPWSSRDEQRLAWPEVLALAVIGHYCDDYHLEIGVFSDSIVDLVILCREHSPGALQNQRLLFHAGRGEFKLLPRSENAYTYVVEEKWLPLDLQEVLDGIWSRMYCGDLVKDAEHLRSAA